MNRGCNTVCGPTKHALFSVSKDRSTVSSAEHSLLCNGTGAPATRIVVSVYGHVAAVLFEPIE